MFSSSKKTLKMAGGADAFENDPSFINKGTVHISPTLWIQNLVSENLYCLYREVHSCLNLVPLDTVVGDRYMVAVWVVFTLTRAWRSCRYSTSGASIVKHVPM
jgi:hypothetical protein